MAWQKSSPSLVAAFAAALPDDAAAERRQMFGYPCAFANGWMFAGLHEERLFVRLGDDDRGELGGAPFDPMPGRPMKDLYVVPPSIVARPDALRSWVARSFAHTLTLAPKDARKPAAAKKPAAKKPAAKRPK